MIEYFIFCDNCGKYVLGSDRFCEECNKEQESKEDNVSSIYKSFTTISYQVKLMKGKPITFWANEEQEKILKEKAKKENRSLSNFIKIKCDVFKKNEK